ncbi:MAG: hypothetical protein ACYCWW_16750 [Deltaproteobacteria bacterium]
MPRPASTHSWINLPAARARLAEITRQLAALEGERAVLQSVLGARTTGGRLAGRAQGRPGRPPGRPARGGPSLLDIITDVMKAGSPSKGWTVGELRVEIAKRDPAKVAAPNASALVSSALVQALRAKRPRFTGSRGGPGHPRKYRLASPAAA